MCTYTSGAPLSRRRLDPARALQAAGRGHPGDHDTRFVCL